jgi:hypothetical protein
LKIFISKLILDQIIKDLSSNTQGTLYLASHKGNLNNSKELVIVKVFNLDSKFLKEDEKRLSELSFEITPNFEKGKVSNEGNVKNIKTNSFEYALKIKDYFWENNTFFIVNVCLIPLYIFLFFICIYLRNIWEKAMIWLQFWKSILQVKYHLRRKFFFFVDINYISNNLI